MFTLVNRILPPMRSEDGIECEREELYRFSSVHKELILGQKDLELIICGAYSANLIGVGSRLIRTYGIEFHYMLRGINTIEIVPTNFWRDQFFHQLIILSRSFGII